VRLSAAGVRAPEPLTEAEIETLGALLAREDWGVALDRREQLLEDLRECHEAWRFSVALHQLSPRTRRARQAELEAELQAAELLANGRALEYLPEGYREDLRGRLRHLRHHVLMFQPKGPDPGGRRDGWHRRWAAEMAWEALERAGATLSIARTAEILKLFGVKNPDRWARES
jgi:hypothetical protein